MNITTSISFKDEDSKMIAIFSNFRGLFFFYGGFSNSMMLLVCLFGKLKYVPNFLILSIISIFSLIHLVSISLTTFIFQISQKLETVEWCRVQAFFSLFTFQCVAWFIAFCSLEIYLSVRDPNFRKKYPVNKIIIYVSVSITLIMCVLDSSAWFIQPQQIVNFNSSKMVCTVLLKNTNSYFLTYATIVIINQILNFYETY